jgi:hypothetical protein
VALGFANAPITNAAVSGMPRAQAGVAAALAATSRQIGATLGVAVAGAAMQPFWCLVLAGGAAIVALGFLATGALAQRSVLAIQALVERP